MLVKLLKSATSRLIVILRLIYFSRTMSEGFVFEKYND
jgi:hypothetical protein